ncbi:hypothetical protein Poli38472_004596 [Pythium oligandrum]|uniref:Glycosyltransferase family 28 N-terminal domain-containing protein n=1 Tax=Pythium oligandrum TaxID=41045 RepID=A0A8K1CAE3_PYTOL|nr:hypothetical protein Poli38472_004596 [Pythium oligandrum]|eukprot:TMW59527.1 hypothetical protein Poli38472_004596 [Pythium oligandrum]
MDANPSVHEVEATGAAEEWLVESNAVEAVAVFDQNGRIQLDFADDDDEYDVSVMQKYLRVLQSVHVPNPRLNDDVVPRMNVCIMIVGTRGDVQPFIGIAKRLQQDGHRVRLATHAVYREFVMEHGVEFYPLGGDPKELAAYMVKTGGHLIPLKLDTLMNDVPRNVQMINEILNSTWPAVSAADPDGNGKGIPGRPFQANAIISNPVTYGHIHVAERLGVPLHIMFPQPWVPTTVFPHPMANMAYDGKIQKRNYVSYKMVDLLMWQGTESMVNKFRSEVLGLRKIRKGDGGRDILLDLAIPHAFMWSPALVPKPHDWGHIYDVIGTVQLKGVGSSYHPTPELETFLGNDGGPIFVGFGSMILKDPAKATKMIIEAASQANVRVLIQSSWSDMAGDIKVPSNVFFLGNCPHDWLMPRVSAVVHHGGAGTTAAGLLAGKPTFIVPFFGDQPFWGRAVLVAGVGVEPCPIGELTVEKLCAAFVQLMDPQVRERAIVLAEVMSREDGVEEAVQSFYRHLPLKHMTCHVCHGQAATKWSTKDKIKICGECELVISSRPGNTASDIIQYQCIDYSARGPGSILEGAASGIGALVHELVGGMKDVVTKPAEGYREQGVKGAVVGFVKGVASGVFIRPVYGGALFADHVITGHRNMWRQPDARNNGSVIYGNKRLRRIVQKNAPPQAHVADTRIPDEKKSAKQKRFEDHDRAPVQVSYEEKQRIESTFYEITKKGLTTSHLVERQTSVPKMNICILTSGSWNDGVQPFVAIGLRLRADGHRVRLATHEQFRERIMLAGLEFFPLGGKSSTLYKYLNHTYGREKENQSVLRLGRPKQDFPGMQDLRDLVFSLWPACHNGDPVNPGLYFRADLIITHPLMFGQSIVAERLGVPIHCIGTNPWSRTQAFGSLLSATVGLASPYDYSRARLSTYDEINKLHSESMRRILSKFRSSLGLFGKPKVQNLLAYWDVPHTYLWDPVLLPKPSDWGEEITIAGHIQGEDRRRVKQESEILAFIAESSSGVLYVGIEGENWDDKAIQQVTSDLEQSAIQANCRIIFQNTGEGILEAYRRSSFAMQISPDMPIKSILPRLAGAIHWGGPSITSACTAAGIPSCVLARTPIEHFWGQAVTHAGAGILPLDVDQLSVSSLIQAMKDLQNPVLLNKARELSKIATSSEDSIERAVKSIYVNLPLEAMVCDLDPTRIARIYDQVHQLKLSHEAQFVVKKLSGPDDKPDIVYKPLKYSQRKFPRYTLRRLDASNGRYAAKRFTRIKEELFFHAPKMVQKALGHRVTEAEHVVEAPDQWTSLEIQEARVALINAEYEKLVQSQSLALS